MDPIENLMLTIGRSRYKVISFRQASVLFRNHITHSGIGASDLKKNDGRLSIGEKTIGHVSYNGRVWLTDGTEVTI